MKISELYIDLCENHFSPENQAWMEKLGLELDSSLLAPEFWDKVTQVRVYDIYIQPRERSTGISSGYVDEFSVDWPAMNTVHCEADLSEEGMRYIEDEILKSRGL